MKHTKSDIKKLFTDLFRKRITDSMMRDLIDTLWRELYWLYKEAHLRDPSLIALTKEELEEQFPELVYTRNILGDTTNFSVLLGHGHESNGDLSIIVGGVGNISNDFKEVLMGGYATEGTGNQKEWIDIDRLIVVGNGQDEENRQNALVIYKSGYTEFSNAIKIGDYSHGEVEPTDGIFRFTMENGPECWWIDRWWPLIGDYYSGWDLYVDGVDKGTVESDKHVDFESTDDIEITYEDKGSGNKKLKFSFPEEIITQEDHGFTGHHPIRNNGTIWVKAQADEAANANTMAFVAEIIDTDTFRIARTGDRITGSWTKGEEYFLDPDVAGNAITLSDPEVWNIGEVRQSLGWCEETGVLTIEIGIGHVISESPFENNLVESLEITGGNLVLSQSLGDDVSCPFPYYTKTELNTSGAGGAVHWDNITNKPTFESDHGGLTGLGDDDHTQYHTDARGDARYYLQSQLYTKTNLQVSGQSAVHWDNLTNVPNFDYYAYWKLEENGVFKKNIGTSVTVDFVGSTGLNVVASDYSGASITLTFSVDEGSLNFDNYVGWYISANGGTQYNVTSSEFVDFNGLYSVQVGYVDAMHDLNISLVNDQASPGGSKYYGTNKSGTKGWFDLPSAGGPAGNDTEIQYNDNGEFGASPKLTFDGSLLYVNAEIFGEMDIDCLRVNSRTSLSCQDWLCIQSPIDIPSNPTSSGGEGTFVWDSGYLYMCIATNSWKRVAINTW